jgi:hypothetical protein
MKPEDLWDRSPLLEWERKAIQRIIDSCPEGEKPIIIQIYPARKEVGFVYADRLYRIEKGDQK